MNSIIMIEINNLTDFSVDKPYFLGVAKKVLKGENKEMENLSIAFVAPGEIKKLNKKYRKKDKPTDVLSFGRTVGFKGEFNEVVICPVVVEEKSEDSEDLKKALARTLVHGVLHTLGYDHELSKKEERQMQKKEKYYLAKI